MESILQSYAIKSKDNAVLVERITRLVNKYKNCLLYTSPSPRD